MMMILGGEPHRDVTRLLRGSETNNLAKSLDAGESYRRHLDGASSDSHSDDFFSDDDTDNLCVNFVCAGTAQPGVDTFVGARLDGVVPVEDFGTPVTPVILAPSDCVDWALNLAASMDLEEDDVYVAYAQDDFDHDGVNDASLCTVATGCPGGLVDLTEFFPENPFKTFTIVPENIVGEDPICSEIADSVFSGFTRD